MFARLTRHRFLAATTAIALGLGAPAMASDLTVAFGADPATLDPTQTGVMSGLSIGRLMFDALTAREFRDGRFVEVPALATSWEFIEPTVFELQLREGVTFHDGTPFTAESVAYTIATVNNPDYRTIMRAYSSNIASVEVVSDHVVRLHLNTPSLILPAQLSWLMMLPPSHAAGNFAANPVGTGPYRFVSYTPGNTGTVTRNEAYWGEAGVSDTITFRILPESATRLAALEAGEVDIVEGIPADKLSAYDSAPNIELVTGLTSRVMSLILNYRQPIMGQRAFREALSNAIDRPGIVEALLNDQTQVANSVSSPAAMGYLADLPPYAYDPESVAGLLAEAGYAGEQIDFGCTGGRYAMDRQVCEAIAGMFTEAGINVNLEIADWPTFITKMYDGSWDLSFAGAPDQLSWPSTSWRFMFYPPTSPTGFSDERITAIVEGIEATTDLAEAARLAGEGQRIFREDYAAALPLYTEPMITGLYGNVEGFALRPDELTILSGVSAE